MPDPTSDYVIIGSGFGGSVSALRLAEKGYTVRVLEKGKRLRDADFPKSNWAFWKYLWLPALRAHGILQMSFLSGMLVLHGAGVGGGSLGYANVLMEPGDAMFDAPGWKDLADWKTALRPHYATAKRMLGVARNPRLGPADVVTRQLAEDMGAGDTFSTTDVGIYFGESGVKQEDPFFEGAGPERAGCIFCGGCMTGCRHNAKNTLVKNYLYLAEKLGVTIQAETVVRDVRPLPAGQPDGARYEVIWRSSTAPFFNPEQALRARNVVFSAGVMGTLGLLFRCRDTTRSLPELSPKLGTMVRTNNEALLGTVARDGDVDYSEGIAIGSIFQADAVTNIEPVRYMHGNGLMRFLAWPLIDSERPFFARLLAVIRHFLTRPLDMLRVLVFPGWARRTTILLVMQTTNTRSALRQGRSLWTGLKRRLVMNNETREGIAARIEVGHDATLRYGELVNGIPAGSIAESLFGMPSTAHILGGCPMGLSSTEGIIGLNGEVHNYPGLFVVDGSTMPANPGINPSLTITALAEYAMSHVPGKQVTGR